MKIKKIALALREAKSSVRQMILFSCLIDTALVIMISLLIVKLLSLSWWIALIPGAIYAAFHISSNVNRANFQLIEKKFPQLEEELITAADNWKQDNIVVEELNEEVLGKMKEIETAKFLEFGKLMRQVSIMAIIAFIIIGASAFDVQFLNLPKAVDELKDFKPFQEYDVNQDLFEMEEGENLSEILGDAEVLELGKEQVDLELNPIESDAQIGTIKDPTQRSTRSVPPREIKASGSGSFEDQIPRQYQRIVKTYFREITQGG